MTTKRAASPTKDGEPVLKKQSREPSPPPHGQQAASAVQNAKDQQKADALKRMRTDVALFRKEIRSSTIYKGTAKNEQTSTGSNTSFSL